MSEAAAAAAPPAVTAADMSSLFAQLTERVQGGAATLRASSMTMAKEIAMRFHQIGGSMTGKCIMVSAQDSQDMLIPRDHKDLFDRLRRNDSAAYNNMVEVARRFYDAETNDQVSLLSAEVPALLQSLRPL